MNTLDRTFEKPVFHSPANRAYDLVKFEVQPAHADPRISEDMHLAQKAGKHDMEAFEELYNRHHRRVYAICLRMLRNATEAEDITQDVFIQLYRKIYTFEGNAAFTSWLHRLTVNQVLMYIRKRSKSPECFSEDGRTPDQIATGSAHPERMQIVDSIALKDAIAHLPSGYRTVYILHDVHGFEHAEIARIMRVSIGTSKSQLHKAKLNLRKLLKKKANPRVYSSST